MQLYVITDRTLAAAPGPSSLAGRDQEPHRPGLLSTGEQAWLVGRARAWAAAGVEFVQLREKDLPPSQLLTLARLLREAMAGSGTRLLLNAPPELARDAGADGVHLPGGWTTAAVAHARRVLGPRAVISLACHTWQTPLEARDALTEAAFSRESLHAGEVGSALALFSPIFREHKPHITLSGKPEQTRPEEIQATAEVDSAPQEPRPALGLEPLRKACTAASPLPVYALGGITAATAPLCLVAGAAGIAAIRLFAGDDWLPLAGRHAYSA